jgi:DNA adenine methylase
MILRYLGRKVRLGADVWSMVRGLSIREYREPFCGGAAMLSRIPGEIPSWINDLDPDVAAFHDALKSQPDFIDRLMEVERKFDGATVDEALHLYKIHRIRWHFGSDPESFYVLHRFACGPIVRRSRANIASMSLGQLSTFRPRSRAYFEAARQRYATLTISQGDYSRLLNAPGQDVLCFIDPPYIFKSTSTNMYEQEFCNKQQLELRDLLSQCNHRWILTIGDCPYARELYSDFNWTLARCSYSPISYRPAQDAYEMIVCNF